MSMIKALLRFLLAGLVFYGLSFCVRTLWDLNLLGPLIVGLAFAIAGDYAED